MAAKTDPATPLAFEIRLGISGGRSSPDSDPATVVVNADTTVNWIFIQAAYVLSHIHGKNRDSLQKEFDLYMVRPGRDDIVLNQSRVIADYNVSRNDLLQLRHKSMPIPICVNLCQGEDRKVEVNSGFPLMDIIPVICQELGVTNVKELSLALPSSAPGGNTMQYEWLDRLSSLHGQGIQGGDTLLLRKKFFILNEDIQEALEGNEVLMELIYQQVREMFTTESYIGVGKDNMASCSKLSALFHHIEQQNENISDEGSVNKVMPKHFYNNAEFYSQTVMNYYGQRVGTLQELEAKKILINYFRGSQTIIIYYFPVKKYDSSSDEDLVLCVDSDRIKVCQKTESHDQLKVLDDMNWRLRDLRDTECVSQKSHHLRVNILGSWHEFLTDHSVQVSRYMMEAQALTKLRVAKGRLSTLNPPGLDIVGEIKQQQQEQQPIPEELSPVASPMSPAAPVVAEVATPTSPVEVISPVNSPTSPTAPVAEAISQINSPTSPTAPVVEATSQINSPTSPTAPVVEATSQINSPTSPTASVVEATSQINSPTSPSVPVMEFGIPTSPPAIEKEECGGISLVPVEECAAVPDDNKVEEEAEFDLDDINEAMEDISESSHSSPAPLQKTKSDNTPIFIAPPPPPSLATTPAHTTRNSISPSKEKEDLGNLGSEASPSKSLSSRSTFVHIPEFLGLDYREVLDDYKLFHVVTMKKDVRIVLLNVNKPVQEVVDSLCGTFDIPNPSGCLLWIPLGIQSIIEKYGGKPKTRAGKFLKKRQSGKDFAPRLDTSKTLKEQYNFSIKPFLLHLRRYQSQEGVDGAATDETDCGMEWPEFENTDVARYRRFYQSWTGVVQGAFPIERIGAVKLAALLTQIYYGDSDKQIWPPRDYDAKAFLAEKHKNSFGIVSEVEKAHRNLSGKTSLECINEVVMGCQQLATMKGVFFEISVPVKSDIFSFIPWNKMEQKWFGVNRNGIFSIDGNTGEIHLTRKLSEIQKWSATENSFKLTFSDMVFDGYTYQTREILDTLELFVQMTVSGEEEPVKRSRPPSLGYTSPIAPIGSFNGELSGNPYKAPLNQDLQQQEIMVSPLPLTYSL